MKRILKFEKNFVPCEIHENDEYFANGIFEFNITRMIEYIESNPEKYIPEPVLVSDYCNFLAINKKHMPNVVLGKPVILAEIAPGRFNLIDGQHRIEKARRENIKEILAYKIRTPEHIPFITSLQAYTSYIEYWNDHD